MRNNNKKFVFILILAFIGVLSKSFALANEHIHEYIQVPGLIDLRTDFSDGAHTLEYLIKLAKKRGIDVLTTHEPWKDKEIKRMLEEDKDAYSDGIKIKSGYFFEAVLIMFR